MPGGAHLNATNHVFNVAEADGLTILGGNPAIAMAQLAKVNAVRFDVRQFQWIGSTGPDGTMFAIRASLPYKTFKDLQNAKAEIVVGTTGPGSNSHDVPMLLKEFAGAKFKLIAGFQANGDIRLALERGEADGWSALATPIRQSAAAGVVRPLLRGRRPGQRIRAPAGGRGSDAAGHRQDRSWSSAARRSRSASRSACGRACRRIASRCCGTPLRRPCAIRSSWPMPRRCRSTSIRISADQVTKDFAAMMNQPPEALEAMLEIHQARSGG